MATTTNLEHQLRVMEHNFVQLQDKYTTDVSRLEREVKFHKEKHESISREFAAQQRANQLLPSVEVTLQQIKEEQSRRSRLENELDDLGTRFKALVRTKLEMDREKERCATNHNAERAAWEDERMQMMTAIDQLRSTKADLLQRLEEKNDERTIRELQHEKSEMQERLRLLMNEMAQLREENAKARWEVESSTVATHQKNQEGVLKIRLLESDLTRAKDKVQRLQIEANEMHQDLDRLTVEKVHQEKVIAGLKLELGQHETALTAERNKSKRILADAENEKEMERVTWRAKIADANRKVEEEQRRAMTAAEHVSELQSSISQRVLAAKEEAQSVITSLERTICELKAANDHESLRHKFESDKLIEELRSVTTEVRALRQQCESSQAEAHDLRLKMDRSKAETTWISGERERILYDNQILQARVRELESVASQIDDKQHEINHLRLHLKAVGNNAATSKLEPIGVGALMTSSRQYGKTTSSRNKGQLTTMEDGGPSSHHRMTPGRATDVLRKSLNDLQMLQAEMDS